MNPADFVGKDGKLVGTLPGGRTVSYRIDNLGQPGARMVADVDGQPPQRVDLTGTIRQMQQGDLGKNFGPADNSFDGVAQTIAKMAPAPDGYHYAGSTAAGTTISHPGAIGDVSVPPGNKFDNAFRTHDIQSFLEGHFDKDVSVTLNTSLGTDPYKVKDFPTVQAEVIGAVRREIRDRALRALADAARGTAYGAADLIERARKAIQDTLQLIVDTAREGLRVAGDMIDRGRQAVADVFGVVLRALRAVAQILRILDDLRLLTSPLPFASEEVFGEILTPTSRSSSDDAAGGKLAVRITDFHECPMVTATVPHVGGPVSTGSGNIYVGGELAARLGDELVCQGPPDTMCAGSSSVFWNGRPAVRVMDATVHGGKTVVGDSAVYVG